MRITDWIGLAMLFGGLGWAMTNLMRDQGPRLFGIFGPWLLALLACVVGSAGQTASADMGLSRVENALERSARAQEQIARELGGVCKR